MHKLAIYTYFFLFARSYQGKPRTFVFQQICNKILAICQQFLSYDAFWGSFFLQLVTIVDPCHGKHCTLNQKIRFCSLIVPQNFDSLIIDCLPSKQKLDFTFMKNKIDGPFNQILAATFSSSFSSKYHKVRIRFS